MVSTQPFLAGMFHNTWKIYTFILSMWGIAFLPSSSRISTKLISSIFDNNSLKNFFSSSKSIFLFLRYFSVLRYENIRKPSMMSFFALIMPFRIHIFTNWTCIGFIASEPILSMKRFRVDWWYFFTGHLRIPFSSGSELKVLRDFGDVFSAEKLVPNQKPELKMVAQGRSPRLCFFGVYDGINFLQTAIEGFEESPHEFIRNVR